MNLDAGPPHSPPSNYPALHAPITVTKLQASFRSKFHFNRLLQLLISRNPDDGMNQIRMGKSYSLSLDVEIESELVFDPVNDQVKDGSLAGVAIG